MTPSNGNIFRLNGPMCREFTDHRWISLKMPMTRGFHVFFHLPLNKLFSKQSSCRRSETTLRSFWCHCIGIVIQQPWIASHRICQFHKRVPAMLHSEYQISMINFYVLNAFSSHKYNVCISYHFSGISWLLKSLLHKYEDFSFHKVIVLTRPEYSDLNTEISRDAFNMFATWS